MPNDPEKPMDATMCELTNNYLENIDKLFLSIETINNKVLYMLIYNSLLKYMTNMNPGKMSEILDYYLLILKYDDEITENNIRTYYNNSEECKNKIKEYEDKLKMEE